MSNGELKVTRSIHDGHDEEEISAAIVEFLRLVETGNPPSPTEFIRRYPHLRNPLTEFFRNEHDFAELAEPIREIQTQLQSDLEALLGRHLGDYVVIEEIGRGGMGIVYSARQKSLGRLVAIKVLSPSLQSKPRYIERFQREAKVAARLHHAHIIPVHGVAYESGYHFYVMQLIDGCCLDQISGQIAEGTEKLDEFRNDKLANELARWLVFGELPAEKNASLLEPLASSKQSRGFSDKALLDTQTRTNLPTEFSRTSGKSGFYQRVAMIGYQISSALSFAHGNGVLHRDIKPGNIMLDRNCHAWIADFGLVKVANEHRLTETNGLLGTLKYMAPESFGGKYDGRSDLYGIGLTLWELLSGKRAFEGEHPSEITRQITERGVSYLQNVPRELAVVVAKSTALNPADRYANADDFAADLGRFLKGEPVLARKISWPEQLARWAGRNRVAAWSLAVTLLVTVTAIIGLSLLSNKLASLATDRLAAIENLESESEYSRRQLVEANLSRAEGLVTSSVPGQKSKALSLIRETVPLARKLDLNKEDRRRILNVAATSLLKTDLELVNQWKIGAKTESFLTVSQSLQRYAIQPVNFGPIEIRSIQDQSLITTIDGQRYWGWKWLSPCNRFIALTTHPAAGREIDIYDLRKTSKIATIGSFDADSRYEQVCFSPGGNKVAIASAKWNHSRLYPASS